MLQAAEQKHEQCRKAQTRGGQPWIIETIREGNDLAGLSTDYGNVGEKSRAVETASALHGLLLELCWSNRSLKAAERSAAFMTSRIYDDLLVSQLSGLQKIGGCFKPEGGSSHRSSQPSPSVAQTSTPIRRLTRDESGVVALTAASFLSQHRVEVQEVSVADNFGLSLYTMGTSSGMALFAKRDGKWRLIRHSEGAPQSGSGATVSNAFISFDGVPETTSRRLTDNMGREASLPFLDVYDKQSAVHRIGAYSRPAR